MNWNLHFIIGKDGEMVQAWVFGPEDQVKSFTEKISQDDYFVFWGDYSVKEKYASKFASTHDWAVYFKSDLQQVRESFSLTVLS